MKTNLYRTALMTMLMGLVLTAGMALAESEVVDQPAINSGAWCLDVSGCNDVILVYSDVTRPNYYSIVGHEYGCSVPSRIIDGSMWIDYNTAHIQWIVNLKDVGARLGQWSAQIDLGVGSGPAQYAYHYDGYHSGTTTASLVACPTSMAATVGPDAAFK